MVTFVRARVPRFQTPPPETRLALLPLTVQRSRESVLRTELKIPPAAKAVLPPPALHSSTAQDPPCRSFRRFRSSARRIASFSSLTSLGGGGRKKAERLNTGTENNRMRKTPDHSSTYCRGKSRSAETTTRRKAFERIAAPRRVFCTMSSTPCTARMGERPKMLRLRGGKGGGVPVPRPAELSRPPHRLSNASSKRVPTNSNRSFALFHKGKSAAPPRYNSFVA